MTLRNVIDDCPHFTLTFLSQINQAKDCNLHSTIVINVSNKEMPESIYIVSWKSLGHRNDKSQTLVLHSLFGDLFDLVHMDITYQTTSSKNS